MKKIPKVSIPGAIKLTPPQMNKIHICTGKHSPR